jgi:hypothetical protein
MCFLLIFSNFDRENERFGQNDNDFGRIIGNHLHDFPETSKRFLKSSA